ncbi:MAG: hypothetical protein AAF671_12005 [Pseudomonadota bacterium]
MIDETKFRAVIDCYGSQPSRWPQELRGEMQQYEIANPDASRWLIRARALDSLLDTYQPSVNDLREEIIDAIPKTLGDRLSEWLLPHSPFGFWKPALAGSIPLLFGVAVGMYSGAYPMDGAGVYPADSWEVEERAMLSPASMTGPFVDSLGGEFYE